MSTVSDRTIRNYRQHLREGKPFHIQLKTEKGLVDIRISEDGGAFMLNEDTAKYDLPLGYGAAVVDKIESDTLIPELSVWFEAKGTSVGEVLTPGYQVLSQLPEIATAVATVKQPEPVMEPAPAKAQKPKSEPSTPSIHKRVASSVLKLIEAYKSGKREFRMWDDSLKERADGVLVWEFGIYRQVDGHMKTIGAATVALFTPNGVEFPSEGPQYKAVIARRALIASEIVGKK